LACAANYKEASRSVLVKSIGLDSWTSTEIELLKKGGNTRFKEYLEQYNLVGEDPKVILRSNAA
jgi:hypothetical protein